MKLTFNKHLDIISLQYIQFKLGGMYPRNWSILSKTAFVTKSKHRSQETCVGANPAESAYICGLGKEIQTRGLQKTKQVITAGFPAGR